MCIRDRNYFWRSTVRVYVRGDDETWSNEAVLTVGDEPEVETSALGWSVAMDAEGTRIVASAPGYGSVGRAYVFARAGGDWSLEATLLPPAPVLYANFGHSVAISDDGDRLLVAAPGVHATDAGPTTGAAYVYARAGTEWMLEAELLVPTARDLGEVVALTADGARAFLCSDAGTAEIHVFARTGTTWTAESVFPPPAIEMPWCQGFVVSTDGNRAFIRGGIGSPWVWTVRVFSRHGATWTEEAPLTTPDGEPHFGVAMAPSADGRVLLVGAVPDMYSEGAGHAYAFYTGTAGTRCDSTGDCVVGDCVDGVCCAEACDGVCEACSIDAGGGEDGRCTGLGPEVAGAEVCRPADGSCDVPETCVPAERVCAVDRHLPDGARCGTDDACLGAEVCTAGRCSTEPALMCDDGDPCTDDSCVSGAGCTHAPACERDAMGDGGVSSDAGLDIGWGSAVDAPSSDMHVVYGCTCMAGGRGGLTLPALLGLVLLAMDRWRSGWRTRREHLRS